jgi:hypothetical protein
MRISSLQTYLLSGIIILALLITGCGEAFDANNPDETITVSGQVINQSNSQAIDSAFVEITSPPENQQSTLSDSTGFYSFSIIATGNSSLTINASKPDFEPQTTTINVAPGADFNGVDLQLTATVDQDGEEDDVVKGEPAGAAAIVLTSNPLQAINIAETGDVVSSPFTFQVQDSAGRPLNADRSVEVQFSLISSPGGGEDVVPASATTNSEGNVTTTLFSGNKAGAVRVQALVERAEDGLVIRSSPVLVAIHGGFPDENHFSIGVDRFNFEGFSINNVRNPITVIVGDKFSNPVRPGTVVSFETTGGIIQGSGGTDADGVVEVDLISGDPRPTDDIAGSGGRPGYATITARTVDENNVSISRDINVVFSTSAAVIDASPKTFDLAPNGGTSFDYTVTDLNGNPMATGTQISIEAGEGIEISGDANFTLGNNLFPGPGSTEFRFSIRDTDDETNEAADLTIQITVTTPSGNTTTFSGISGTRR